MIEIVRRGHYIHRLCVLTFTRRTWICGQRAELCQSSHVLALHKRERGEGYVRLARVRGLI